MLDLQADRGTRRLDSRNAARRRPSSTAAVLMVLAAVFGAWCSTSAAGTKSKRLPSLSVTAPPLTTVAGSRFKLAGTVTAKATPTAAAVARYFLSIDPRLSADDQALVGSQRVRAMRKGQRTAVTTTVRTARRTRPGVYLLLVCVGRPGVTDRKRYACSARDLMQVMVKPHPLTVAPVLDNARSSTALVGTNGGTLSVTATDGSKLTLSIPAGALSADQEITLTPITSLGTLPKLGTFLLAGVHLSPNGLSLARPARLRIVPSRTTRPERAVAFTYAAQGSEFHLRPSASDGRTMTMNVVHFSGVGMGSATEAAQSRFAAAHPPTSAAAQSEQNRATAADPAIEAWQLRDEGMEIANGDLGPYALDADAAYVPRLLDWTRRWREFARVNSFPPQADVEREVKIVRFLFIRTLAEAIDDAAHECAYEDDIRQATGALKLRDALLANNFNFTIVRLDSPDPKAPERWPLADALMSMVKNCLRFHVRLEVHVTVGGGDTIELLATADFPVTLSSTSPWRITGEGPLSVSIYQVADIRCYTHTTQVSSETPVVLRGLSILPGTNDRYLALNGPIAAMSVAAGSVNDIVTHIATCPNYDGSTRRYNAYDHAVRELTGGSALTPPSAGAANGVGFPPVGPTVVDATPKDLGGLNHGNWFRKYEAGAGDVSGRVEVFLRHDK